MKLVRWLKNKVENRRGRTDDHDPWWVTLMLDVGRPAVAALILTMCAPGEHFLAAQSGLNSKLAWGMPGTLTAYAGIAAVVATKRRKGLPGRRTAVLGAIMAVLLAMAAQPVAHLYGRFGEPTREQQIWLIVVIGMIPAAVFGHLLHMGASSPKLSRPAVPDSVPSTLPSVLNPAAVRPGPSGTVRTVRMDPVPVAVQDSRGQLRWTPTDTEPFPDSSPSGDSARWTPDNLSDTDSPNVSVSPVAADSPEHVRDTVPPVSPVRVRRTQDGSMRSVARDILLSDPDTSEAVLSQAIKDIFGQDSKPNSVKKSITRARQDIEGMAS
jgi:hypothetical protein